MLVLHEHLAHNIWTNLSVGEEGPEKIPTLVCMQASPIYLPPTTLEGAGKNEEHTCPLCQEAILEATSDSEGYEAVFCDEVSCRVWYHRWCAGVANKRYELLAGSETPFLCPVCVMGQQSCIIAALQEAVKSLTIRLAELQL